MNRFTATSAQKWKVVMYAFILVAFLMNVSLTVNDSSFYYYLTTILPSTEKRYFMFLVIYLAYMFFHILILIGATKSKSRILYMIPIYWALQIYWLIAHYLKDCFPALPLLDLYKKKKNREM